MEETPIILVQCNVCKRLFPDQRTLETHILTCSLKANPSSASFFNAWKEIKRIGEKQIENKGEKMLPPSQPLTGYKNQTEENDGDEEEEDFHIDIFSSSQKPGASQIVENVSHNQSTASDSAVCTYCNKIFKTRGLTVHLRSCKKKHSSEKKVNQKFLWKSQLQRKD